MSSIAYKASSEEDWKEKTEFLYKHGKTKPFVSDWSYVYPVIVVYDTPMLGGNFNTTSWHKEHSWEEVLKFIGVKPKKAREKKKSINITGQWYVEVNNETARLIQKFRPNLLLPILTGPVQQIYAIGMIGDNQSGYENLSSKGYYERCKTKKVSLEDAILYFQTHRPAVTKTCSVKFVDDTVEIDGVVYSKKKERVKK